MRRGNLKMFDFIMNGCFGSLAMTPQRGFQQPADINLAVWNLCPTAGLKSLSPLRMERSGFSMPGTRKKSIFCQAQSMGRLFPSQKPGENLKIRGVTGIILSRFVT
jgi:hypothetical protein